MGITNEILALQPYLAKGSMFLTKDYAKSRDLLQEVLMKAIEKQDKWNVNKGSLKSWTATLLHNTFIDGLRKRVIPTTSVDGYKEDGFRVQQPAHDFDHIDMLDRMYLAFEELKPRAREIMTLRAKGFKFQSIAKSLGITEVNARSIAHISKPKLKKIIEKQLNQ